MAGSGAEEAGGGEIRFLADRMLGTLARNLRMFGLDTEYGSRGSTEELIERAARQGRWFLTRKSPSVVPRAPVLRITEDLPHLQVVEVLRALPSPPDPSGWFSRCLLCNEGLADLSPEEAQVLVPEYVSQVHRQFRHCHGCGRVFWPGTHSVRMRQTMEEWLRKAGGGGKESSEP